MKAHSLLERNGKRYLYHLTEKGTKVALMFVLFITACADRFRTPYSTIGRKNPASLPAALKLPITRPITPSSK